MKTIYIKTDLVSVINITKIVTVYNYSFDENFVFAGEKHDFWELVYVEKGSVQITADREEAILREGDIVFHAPNEFHAIRSYQSSPHFYVVSFVCGSEAMRFFRKYRTALNGPLREAFREIMEEAKHTYVVPTVYRGINGLERQENTGIGGDQMVKTGLERFLIRLLRLSAASSGVFRSREDMEAQLVRDVKDYVERHLTERIDIAAVCRHINYSKTYLCRVFHAVTGDTVMHHINARKIGCAMEMIRDTDLPFYEIAERLSFDNPQYFSLVFKRFTGMSPKEYRMTVRPDSGIGSTGIPGRGTVS